MFFNEFGNIQTEHVGDKIVKQKISSMTHFFRQRKLKLIIYNVYGFKNNLRNKSKK